MGEGDNFERGITWLYMAAAIIFSELLNFFFSNSLHVVTLRMTRKSPSILCKKWGNRTSLTFL